MTKSRTGRTQWELPVLAVLIAVAILVLAVTS